MSKYYDATAQEVVAEVKSNQYTGLSLREAKARLKRDGRNVIYPIPKGFFREYLIHMLTDFTSILLLISALLCLIFEHDTTAVVIALTVVIGYGFCALVFLRAQKVLENMGAFAQPVVKVMRDSRLFIARSEQIVRGDIIFLCAGDVVPADVRLLESEAFAVDEQDISANAYVQKNADFTAASALKLEEQKNLAFAGSVVLDGSAKAIVIATGAKTAVRKMGKSRPIVSQEKLRILERLRKICGAAGVGMLVLVFVLTAVTMFAPTEQGLFDNLLTFLSLAVASMAELYMAFGYIIVACGIFGALRQYKNINAGALIKNSAKIDALRRISCIVAPKDGCFLVDEIAVDQIYCDDILYDVRDPHLPAACDKILEYAVISTGIYGARNLVSINSARNNVFSTEENAIISCAQEHALYNHTLDRDYPLLDHVSAGEYNLFDTTLVRGEGSNTVIVRGDALSLINRCTHRRSDGKVHILGADETNELMLAANRMSIGGYRVSAVATKETSVIDLVGLSRAQARLTFEGFLVYKETLLPDAAKNLRACTDAGIKVIMLTDTVSESNRYTARSLGVIKNDEEILTAKEFAVMDEGVLVADIRKYSLFEGFDIAARRKLVHLLQTAGERVAYLGSTVGEAPILSEAEVGYCVSVTLSVHADKGGVDTYDKKIPILLKSARDGTGRGCDALKITSDVIVSAADAEGGGGFNAIVKSICVAKSIYQNLFHMFACLTCNQFARLILVITAVFTGAFKFSPVQIVISGLMLDFGAALVFAFDKPAPGILSDAGQYESKLKNLLKNLLPSLAFAAGWAIVTALSVLIGRLLGMQNAAPVFFSFLLTQLVTLIEFRSEGSIFRAKEGFNNVFALLVASVGAFLAVLCLLPGVAANFGMSIPGRDGLLLSLIPPIVVFAAFEVKKLVRMLRALPPQERKAKCKFLLFAGHKAGDDQTAEYIRQSFEQEQAAQIEYQDQSVEEEPDAIPADQARELVRLSVQCALLDCDPAAFSDPADCDPIIDAVSEAISIDSSQEIIATVLIATFSANGASDVRFDACMECAAAILENMSL